MTGERLAILGVGLLGGSVALAARDAGVADDIVGFDRSPEALRYAWEHRLVDRTEATPAAAVAGATLVVVAVPVDRIVALVREIAPHCRPGTLITDVGSTKGFVAEAEVGLPPGVTFLGSHPLAGSEKHGPAHARANLFRGRCVVVTPTGQSPAAEVDRLERFWNGLGAEVRRMSAERHDEAVAWTSHLPHLIVYALAGCLPLEFVGLVAGGFRDTTRVAGSDPEFWLTILSANREATLAALAGFREQLAAMESALIRRDDERLLELLRRGNAVRQAIQG